ncbi:hypothetical protein [Streptomyces sp. NPDC008150]|uniref:hypothetical protein n=1 Tax=Streptomyces sp. NPDC008150 TaxID=3364816 RepID=UPI0036EBE3C4
MNTAVLASAPGLHFYRLTGAVLLLFALAVLLLVLLGRRVARRGTLWAPEFGARCRETALYGLAASFGTYGAGLLFGFMQFGDDAKVCSVTRYGLTGQGHVLPTATFFPLSNSCYWPDGFVREFVPVYINPVLTFFLTTAVLAGAVGLAMWLPERRGRARDEDGDVAAGAASTGASVNSRG